jgi:sec-independent protein translocase protein TatA
MVNLIPLFLGNFRGWEWIIVGVAILLLFGGKRIPDLMRNLGKGIRGFKEGLNDMKDEINRPLDTNSTPNEQNSQNED